MTIRRFSSGSSVSRKRLDKLLVAACSDLSRSRIQSLIESGAVTVAGKVERRASRLVEDGACVEMILPDLPPKAGLLPEDIPLSILFEDDDLLVLDKPPGIVVHPAPGHHSGTLVNAILHHCRAGISSAGDPLRPGIVHRLDRDTSGVLVVAKSDRAHESLARQMKRHTIEKEYVALAAGRPKVRKGEIHLAIGRDPKDRKKMKAFSEAAPPAIRDARTLYAIDSEWPALGLSLLRLRLVTGRTHQIRVHLAAIHCPVVGDPVYGHPGYEKVKDARLKKALASFPRQALHAESIAFHHPATNEWVKFTSPMPEDLRRLVEEISR
jgi:23S rRNA pseudouridine1911/1915/1917 synthase